MKEIERRVHTYKADSDYIVYIIGNTDDESWECWLQNKEYGVMSLMFGLQNKYLALEDVIEICKNNLEREIDFYKDKYED